MIQTEYYKKFKIFPYDKLNKKKIISDDKIKSNLYSTLLKIPSNIFGHKKILDIGCGRGENSLYFANNSNEIYLLDADNRVKKEIKKLFKFTNKEKFLKKIYIQPLDKFKTDKKFDLILIQGWLFTDLNYKKKIKKISSFCKKGSLLILSYPNLYGSFFEIIKKTALFKLINLEQKYSKNQIVSLGKKLFSNSFTQMQNSRKIDTWILDNLLGPNCDIKYFWSNDQIYKDLYKNNFIHYASTPVHWDIDNMHWYKNIIKPDKILNEIINQDKFKKFNYLMGTSLDHKEKKCNFSSTVIINLIRTMSNYSRKFNNQMKIKNIENIEKELLSLPITKKISEEIVLFIKLIIEEECPKKFTKKFKLLKNVSKLWGKSYHHLAAIKI